MKLRKNWKRFWTLNRHYAEGFTLVELIVVIAILAILGGVAIPAYSGYVKKANMQADMTLASEVAHALTLYYYDNIDDVESTYVILTTSGAEAEGAAADAMEAAFGAGWEDTAVLKYDGWSDDGMLAHVLENADTAGTVAGSNYFTNSDTTEILDTVNTLTNAATTVVVNRGGDVKNDLNTLIGMDAADELRADIAAMGIKEGDASYNTVMSNLLVTYMAKEISTGSPTSIGGNLATMYAMMYAYAAEYDKMDSMDAVNKDLAEANSIDDLTLALQKADFFDDFYEYSVDGNNASDQAALNTIMGTVDIFSDDLKNKDSMTNKDLYKSESVTNKLNNYVNATTAVSRLSAEQIAVLKTVNGGIVVFVLDDGKVVIAPELMSK